MTIHDDLLVTMASLNSSQEGTETDTSLYLLGVAINRNIPEG